MAVRRFSLKLCPRHGQQPEKNPEPPPVRPEAQGVRSNARFPKARACVKSVGVKFGNDQIWLIFQELADSAYDFHQVRKLSS